MSVIELTSKAEREVPADMMEITVVFKASGTSSDKVSKCVMDDAERFLSKINDLGIEPDQVSLKADELVDYSYRDDKEINARRELQITTPLNVGLSNRLREILHEGGYSFLFSVEQELSNRAEIRAELLKEALLNSRKMAEDLAASMNMRVDSIESVEEESESLGLHCERERGISNMNVNSSYSRSDKMGAQFIKENARINVKWRIV